MEIVAELLIGALQIAGELLVQLLLEALVEVGLHAAREPFRLKPAHPWAAVFGYTVLGLLMGGLSVLIWPVAFVSSPVLRVVNLVVTPVIAGSLMALMGAWRRRRGQEALRIDRFACGFLFAAGMAAVRFFFADIG